MPQNFAIDFPLSHLLNVARNDYRPGSDIDILVLVPGKVDTKLEIEILDLAYDIELKHDVVFGLVVNEKKFWNSKKASVMPFHQNLQREVSAQFEILFHHYIRIAFII